eukprot:TRINITY_DN18848_c0_g1_i2.p1 TRINITY_DN18848_c0_g1~~TRINITY_DN18848_c0_g1_i2.p1  ORF type:complete len:144 (-),score=53.09 TRINITY_DN18848_c0_g1_i2:331-762(-)
MLRSLVGSEMCIRDRSTGLMVSAQMREDAVADWEICEFHQDPDAGKVDQLRWIKALLSTFALKEEESKKLWKEMGFADTGVMGKEEFISGYSQFQKYTYGEVVPVEQGQSTLLKSRPPPREEVPAARGEALPPAESGGCCVIL